VRASLAIFLVLGHFLISRGGAASLSPQTQNLSNKQALEDFDVMIDAFRNLYGPLSFKEARFGYTLDQLVNTYRAEVQASRGDVDTFAAFQQFISSFHDAHVSLAIPGNATDIKDYTVGVFLTPVEGKALVGQVGLDAETEIKVGDECLAIDGVKPQELLTTVLKYDSLANKLSDQQFIFYTLVRPFYLRELVPSKPFAQLEFQHPDGSKYQAVLPWIAQKDYQSTDTFVASRPINDSYVHRMNQIFQGSTVLSEGAIEPFFDSAAVKAKFGWVTLAPNSDYLKKYSLTAATAPNIYSALYRYKGKNLLLVRQPSYIPQTTIDNALNGYRAILDQYQSVADLLILDQTHNPGGDLEYASGFFSLFAKQQSDNFVEHLHADRKWIFDLRAEASDALQMGLKLFAQELELGAQIVDETIAAKADLTTPLPLVGLEHIDPDSQFTWNKPMLVLADELSGSCGDVFPMLIQRNHVAKIFGQTTMGAGGNVEPVVTLPNSQATLNFTRGLYTTYRRDGNYSNADLVENVGITPDIVKTISAADFRAGYVDYVASFSEAAIAQIR